MKVLALSTPCVGEAWTAPPAPCSVVAGRSCGRCFLSPGLGDVLAFHFFMVLTGRSDMTRFARGTEVLLVSLWVPLE